MWAGRAACHTMRRMLQLPDSSRRIAASRRTIARFAISAALPCGTVFLAWRSAAAAQFLSRSLILGKRRSRPPIVRTLLSGDALHSATTSWVHFACRETCQATLVTLPAKMSVRKVEGTPEDASKQFYTSKWSFRLDTSLCCRICSLPGQDPL